MGLALRILSIIGYMLKVVLDSAISTTRGLVFGILLLVQTVFTTMGFGSTAAMIVATIITVAIFAIVVKYLWNVARGLALVVLGIIVISIILSIVAPAAAPAAPPAAPPVP